MVQFDWLSTLIGTSIALLGICLSFPSVRAWLRRLWGSLCDRLAQWRHSLPRIYPGGTSDVEQGLDDHSTELDDLSRAILPAPSSPRPPNPPSSSPTSLPFLPVESIGLPRCPPPPPPPIRLRTVCPRPPPPLPPLRAADRLDLAVHLSTMVVRVVPHS
ncbi:hypothetical protein N7465_002874 [Penicillium sp. CMV-2018d]|nr:hypothetical protein N7465_002874 [Penicillium sp. CMV-2018d]